MTSPNPDWALIIHADSADTRVDVYWVDIRAGRLGLQLAREVKAWRKRDDLLTLGQRFRVVEPPIAIDPPDTTYGDGPDDPSPAAVLVDPPPPPAVDPPPLPPTVPQDDRRRASRHDYIRGRVAAVLRHSDTAGKALQRSWPTGVPGLKHEGHSWDQLDDIYTAVVKVEKDHSVPFYPAWDDPDIERAKQSHPSWVDRWSKPSAVKEPPSPAELGAIKEGLMNHPRRALLQRWIGEAITGGIVPSVDTTALAHALYEFASVDAESWNDDDLTLMLDGSLRTMGYVNGMKDLGKFNPDHAPLLMSAAFAIAAGNATLIMSDDGTPEVLTNVIKR